MLLKSEKCYFDEFNPSHVREYANFIDNNRSWKTGCPFKLEEPFISIPHMIESKLSIAYCNSMMKMTEELID